MHISRILVCAFSYNNNMFYFAIPFVTGTTFTALRFL